MVRPLVPLIGFPIVHGDNQFVGRLLPLIYIDPEITVCGKLLQNLRYFQAFFLSGESAASPYLCLLLLHNALSNTKVKEAPFP
ncbi:hypothetical protein VNO80_33048 [Phaseolus coccineus]|uniref:Uncharacterized protein n=1 Tax=Phaseolus coccineus TaxID=3886 RepID=A0AAN9KYK1_PHACN